MLRMLRMLCTNGYGCGLLSISRVFGMEWNVCEWDVSELSFLLLKKKRGKWSYKVGLYVCCARKKTPRLAFPFKYLCSTGDLHQVVVLKAKLSTSDRPFGFRRPSLRPSVTLKAAQTNKNTGRPDANKHVFQSPMSKPPCSLVSGPLGSTSWLYVPFPPGCAAAWP